MERVLEPGETENPEEAINTALSESETTGLKDEAGRLLTDMLSHGYELIIPSEVRKQYEGAAGSYKVVTDTASYNPNSQKSFDAIMSHEFVHSTQENQEFGPMSKEEHQWISQRIQQYESLVQELPHSIRHNDIQKVSIGQALQDTSKLHESARHVHQIDKLRNQREKKIEDSNGVAKESGLRLTFTPIYGKADPENIQEIQELEQREEDIRSQLLETLNAYADSERNRMGENCPIENSQIEDRVRKHSHLNSSTTRFYEEIPAYLTTFAYQDEPLIETTEPHEKLNSLGEDERDDLIDELTGTLLDGVDGSTGDREVPSEVGVSAEYAAEAYISKRAEMHAKSAAAEVANDWLYLF